MPEDVILCAKNGYVELLISQREGTITVDIVSYTYVGYHKAHEPWHTRLASAIKSVARYLMLALPMEATYRTMTDFLDWLLARLLITPEQRADFAHVISSA